MKTRISAVPQDNVLIINSGGYCNVSLFKNVVEIESGENNEKQYEADIVSFSVKEISKEQVLAYFDWYWDKAIAKDLERAKAYKITELQHVLAKTDYEAIKFSEGVISTESYAEMGAARAAWRKAINDIEACKTVSEVESVSFSLKIPKIN